MGLDKIDKNYRLSFREFIDLLKEVDIRSCNIHWRSQVHPLERLGLFEVKKVRLKDSMTEIPNIEKEFNLKKSSKTRLSNYKNRNHHSIKKAESDFANFVGDIKYTWDEIQESPPAILFYNIRLRREVFRIYKEDFKFYDFEKISEKFEKREEIERNMNK